MKIITLNTWGGRAGKDGLLEFFKLYKGETEIFCLQEIWSAPYENLDGHVVGGKALDHSEIMTQGLQEISALLPEFTPYFRPHYLDHYGLLMLVRSTLQIVGEGEHFVYKEKGHQPEGDIGNHARNIQFVTVRKKGKDVTVLNFHGLWNGKGKTDTPDRIAQSQNILDFMHNIPHERVLCGDFNLLPDTRSLTMFEDAGYQNMIKVYGVTSTRTSHYTKPEKFADYIFVSKGVKVKNFEVLPEEVSDHAPLLLEIEK